MLLDTSGLLCVLHRDEAQHTQAALLFRSTRAKLIHNYVLAEFVALCTARRIQRNIALAFAQAMLDSDDIQVMWVGEELHRAAAVYLASRLDKSYSLCDAVSFLLMQQRGLTDALTTDRHFDQAGFRRLLS
ncbi:MAG: PIN domain-containing protein [Anaerolineae bacterium]